MNQNQMDFSKIDEILSRRKIIITCGTGGVGKTTLSAAIAIRAALLGKKTVVITIDPAKRLAHSLGLESLTDEPTDLTDKIKQACEKLRSTTPSLPKNLTGSLGAVVPDTRRTFENFVTELASDPSTAERVIQNPIFQIFAKEFSGTNEYMALERLLALHKRGNYDCIILDTPPSRNTLAFLDAPKLLTQFFEERLIRWLVLPANKLVSAGMRKALSILEKLTGTGFMTSLFEFASALFEVQVKFTSNLKKITTLLESPSVGFLMVTNPAPDTAPEANHFIHSLKEHRFHFDGLILNKTVSYLEASPSSPHHEAAYTILRALQEREQLILKNLMKNPISVCAILPELARDVHSISDLLFIALAFHQQPYLSK